MELNCENPHFPLQDGFLQRYRLNNSLFLVPAFYSLNCSLAGARSQISTTCISKKKSNDPYLALQSHIFKSSVCASDLKRIENRGSREKKKRNQTFLSRCLNFNWFQKHWKQQPRKENRNHTQPAAQHADGAAEKCSKCALCPGRNGYHCNAWPILFHCRPETALVSASARESRKAHEIISPRPNSHPKIATHVEVLV